MNPDDQKREHNLCILHSLSFVGIISPSPFFITVLLTYFTYLAPNCYKGNTLGHGGWPCMCLTPIGFNSALLHSLYSRETLFTHPVNYHNEGPVLICCDIIIKIVS